MKGQGKVKGILIEGNDGHEYLLGFGPDNSPIFSRDYLASRLARPQL
jgi:hypothetical protein